MEIDFPALFDQYYDPVAAYLVRRHLDRATAEDIAQTTFLTAYDRRATYDESRGAPRAWLYGIATNLMRRHFRDEQARLRAYARAASREVEPPDRSDDSCRRIDAGMFAGPIAAALATLSRGDYEVLTLHCWAELSDREIATAVGIPTGTVKSRLHRARCQMRTQLNPSILEQNDG
jgi:RNA polymerase sigma-70 factor (ECF subfamily)